MKERFFLPPSSSLAGQKMARRQVRNLVVAGIFIVMMIISFLSALYWLSQGTGKRYSIYAYFKEVPDIRSGSHIFQAGYPIGVVGDVEPLIKDDSLTPLFRVILKIDQKWQIPDDSRASIAAAGPLQVNAININPGNSSVALRHGQKILSGDTKPGLIYQMDEVPAYLQILAENLHRISIDVRKLVSAVDLGSLGKLLSSTQGALDNVGGLTQSLEANFGKIEKVLSEYQKLGELLNKAITKNEANIQKALSGAVVLMQDLSKIEKLLSEYQKLGESLNKAITKNEANIEKALAEATFLIQDLSTELPPILESVEETIRNLQGLSRDLRDNPSVIIRGRKRG